MNFKKLIYLLLFLPLVASFYISDAINWFTYKEDIKEFVIVPSYEYLSEAEFKELIINRNIKFYYVDHWYKISKEKTKYIIYYAKTIKYKKVKDGFLKYKDCYFDYTISKKRIYVHY